MSTFFRMSIPVLQELDSWPGHWLNFLKTCKNFYIYGIIYVTADANDRRHSFLAKRHGVLVRVLRGLGVVAQCRSGGTDLCNWFAEVKQLEHQDRALTLSYS